MVTFLVCSVGGKLRQTRLFVCPSPKRVPHFMPNPTLSIINLLPFPPSLLSACHDLTSASPPSPPFLPPLQPTGPHLLRRRRRLHKLLQGFGGHRVQLLAGTCMRRPAHGVTLPGCGEPRQCSSTGGSLATGGCKGGESRQMKDWLFLDHGFSSARVGEDVEDRDRSWLVACEGKLHDCTP